MMCITCYSFSLLTVEIVSQKSSQELESNQQPPGGYDNILDVVAEPPL